jgi:CARDB protein/matrixin
MVVKIWKLVNTILVFMMVVFSVAFVLDNLPRKPVELKTNYLEPEREAMVEYGAVPVFAENLRFNHNLISYLISEDCDFERRSDMVEAFNIFADKMKIVSFYEVVDDADILVGCSDDFIKLGEELFAAGEGGPSRIINTSLFRTIEEGKITLYNRKDCDYPIVALHELCHVFGFDHSEDPMNTMYSVADCRQRMSEDMVVLMVELYSIEALADARINWLNASLKGKYLSFNISVLNEGMLSIDALNLTILADGEEVQVVDLGEIGIGFGRILRVENMRMSSSIDDKLEFILDAEDKVRELNEGNNVVEVVA